MRFFFERYPLPILLISLLFAVKAIYLSFWVTPLWDIPDEIGHFAYVQDLAESRGLPLLGKAKINLEIMHHLKNDQSLSSPVNWIAQHPPIYYLIAAIPLKIGSWMTNDPEILFRLPRIISALSGALLLLVLFRTFLLVGLDVARATGISATVGFIPMVTHLSSGTSHDVSLFLFCALATYFFARYLIFRNLRDVYWCALWLTIAGGTKMMTPWALLAPMIAILFVELPGPIKNWIKNVGGVSLLTLSVPLAWMTRNIVYFGNPFYTSGTNRKTALDVPLNHSFFDYLHLQPVFEHFVVNFYGQLGGIGTGIGALKWFQVSGLPREVFSMLIFSLSCISVIYVFLLMYRALNSISTQPKGSSLISWASNLIIKNKFRKLLIVVMFLVAILFAGYINMKSFVIPSLFGGMRGLAVAMIIFAAILAVALLFFTSDPVDRIALYGMVISVFFGAILLSHVYGAYLEEGGLRAAHGRYFYPVIPIVLLSISIAVLRLRIPAFLIALVATILGYAELETYVLQAIPFYLSGSL
ncbi:MAG: hypothetical protein NTV66_07570 [Methylococcales bacterium]|nr:hypothetical protein [Methylococcales bacterium]